MCIAENYKKQLYILLFDPTGARGQRTNHYITDNRSNFNLLERYILFFIAGVSEESLMEKPSELQIGKIVSQLTFPQLKSVLIHLGLSNSEIETIQFDNQGNIQNIMFLCLQHWRRKQLDGTLADIKKALVEEKENTHILCKVSMPACRLLPKHKKYLLFKVKGSIKNGQSKYIGKIGQTRHRTKTNKQKKNQNETQQR